MREVTGHCPSCHAEGPVGQPCGENPCQRRGYHFIPEESFTKVRELPAARIDPRIGQCIGEYLVVDVLGAGGFGKVYLVLQLPILMKAALKVMERPEQDPELLAALAKRFEGEAAALATLTHPNIVRLLKYGVHEGVPFLVMEFVEGNRTLRNEMQTGALQSGHMDPKVTVHVLRQILNALDAAHQRGIVHRDVKPENVMLQEISGDPWFVKVLDFGLAKFVEERSETSLMVGTPAYMAPEQITRRNIGPWTDLYAVGVLAFRLITGRLPFQGDSTQETYAMKLDASYDPLCQAANNNLSPLLVGFLRQSLARDPESRFRTAAACRKAFDAVADTVGQDYAGPSSFDDAVAEAAREPAPRPERRKTARDTHQGHSMTEEVRRVGDEAFAQMGSSSVVSTEARRITAPQPVRDRRPKRRLVGAFELTLLVLAGLAVGIYMAQYGPTTAPIRQWLARAEAYMDREVPVASSNPGAVLPPPEKRAAIVHLVTTPPAASFHNEDTGDELGETPSDILIPPGGTLRIHVLKKGYKDQVFTLTHADALHQPELPIRLVRE